MIYLMKLEMKKFKLFPLMIKTFLVLNVVFLLILSVVGIISKEEGEQIFSNYDITFSLIDSIIRSSYIVFAAVLISILVIDEFKNKTINVLSSYPVSRKKIMTAKLMIIVLFTFVAIILSTLITVPTFYLIINSFNFIQEPLSKTIIYQYLLDFPIYAFTAAGMSLIPLYFGLWKNSVPITIVSSLVIVAIVGSNYDGFSLSNFIAIPIGLGVIGLFIGYLSIRRVENIDLGS